MMTQLQSWNRKLAPFCPSSVSHILKDPPSSNVSISALVIEKEELCHIWELDKWIKPFQNCPLFNPETEFHFHWTKVWAFSLSFLRGLLLWFCSPCHSVWLICHCSNDKLCAFVTMSEVHNENLNFRQANICHCAIDLDVWMCTCTIPTWVSVQCNTKRILKQWNTFEIGQKWEWEKIDAPFLSDDTKKSANCNWPQIFLLFSFALQFWLPPLCLNSVCSCSGTDDKGLGSQWGNWVWNKQWFSSANQKIVKCMRLWTGNDGVAQQNRNNKRRHVWWASF